MAGPWERFQQPQIEESPPVGPWERFSRQQEGMQFGPQPEEPSMLDRLGTATASTAQGLAQGASLGLYDEYASLVNTPIQAVQNIMTGQDSPQGVGDVLDFIGRSYGQSRDREVQRIEDARQADPVAFTAGEIGGGLALGTGMAGSGATLMNAAKPTVGSMMARGAGEGAFYGAGYGYGTSDEENLAGRIEDAGWGALWGALTGGAIGGIGGAVAQRAANKSVPGISELKQQASLLYDDAARTGLTANQQQTQGLSSAMRDLARQEGLISESGRVAQSYPRISDVLNAFDDYANGQMTVPQMQAVRRLLQGAAGSSDGAERRIGMMMLNQFDDFTAQLAPELAQARSLYHRAMKAEEIQELVELAGSRAGQFSGSGFENALRTEFRNLERKIIRGQVRGFSQEEIDAISRVAQGDSLSNFFRNIGRRAPTGVVSAMYTQGFPFMVGTAMSGGNPMVGAGAAGVASGLTYGARGIATRMGINNANTAEALMRAGSSGIPQNVSPVNRAVTNALIAGAANQNYRLPRPDLQSFIANNL